MPDTLSNCSIRAAVAETDAVSAVNFFTTFPFGEMTEIEKVLVVAPTIMSLYRAENKLFGTDSKRRYESTFVRPGESYFRSLLFSRLVRGNVSSLLQVESTLEKDKVPPSRSTNLTASVRPISVVMSTSGA